MYNNARSAYNNNNNLLALCLHRKKTLFGARGEELKYENPLTILQLIMHTNCIPIYLYTYYTLHTRVYITCYHIHMCVRVCVYRTWVYIKLYNTVSVFNQVEAELHYPHARDIRDFCRVDWMWWSGGTLEYI